MKNVIALAAGACAGLGYQQNARAAIITRGEKSRNYTVGFRLGKGEKLDHVIATLGSVAEGVETTKAAYALSLLLDGIEAFLHQRH
ncbi:hypothetical protein HDU78_000643, partial [Chytriomyces hyalinus]